MAGSVEVVLPGELESSSRARRELEPLRGALDETRFGDLRYGDLRLLVSELVAEAAGAFGSPPAQAINVRVEIDQGRFLASVKAERQSFRTPRNTPEPGRPGWSVYLVQRMSDDWGIRRDRDSATVWFELTARPKPRPRLGRSEWLAGRRPKEPPPS